MVVKPQGQIDQRRRFGNDFGAAAETGQIMAQVAVILLDGKGQVFAGEKLSLGNEAVKALPSVSQEGVTREADFFELLLTSCIITPTQKPG